ncbi:cell division protein FtsZ [Emcibacter sp. SYSU 3D8]|uniref:cell division protein FtsZ n=1 Tax=Emcibacter sp. SYSU 3D8 TaxID=3133969 RepID=UPI0031FECA08
MAISLSTPAITELRPKILVVGVGGAGGNAVNNMIRSKLEGVEFVVANTDAQALGNSLCERRIQLGVQITQGLGAGARPDIGAAAAQEAIDHLREPLAGAHMAFITAGMGGGTGTGAAPVIARMARDQGILTIGVVTKPFQFEGARRMTIAEEGIEELQKYVDTLIIIPNQNLFRLANEKTTFADAFNMADNVLHSGVRGITDLMVMPGLINLDFADVRTVMMEMGKAMMGTGEAEGDTRAIEAAEAAINNPLLDEVSMKGAHGVLINITGGLDLTLFEVDEAANRIRSEVDPDANIIVGSTFSEAMNGKMRVSVFATGIEAENATRASTTTVMSFPSIPAQPRTGTGYAGGAATAAVLHQPGRAAAAPAMPAAMSAAPLVSPMTAEASPVAETMEDAEELLTLDVADMVSEETAGPVTSSPADFIAPAREAASAEIPVRPSPRDADAFFAPPKPMEPERAPVAETRVNARPDPFAEAAMANGATPAPSKPSLFERMTGRGKKPETVADRSGPRLTREEAPMTLRNAGPRTEAASGTGTEDQIDIPAFLRRQAN